MQKRAEPILVDDFQWMPSSHHKCSLHLYGLTEEREEVDEHVKN